MYELIIELLLIYNVSKIKDDYGIINELIMITILWFITTISGIILYILLDHVIISHMTYVYSRAIVALIRSISITIITLIIPVIQSYNYNITLWSNCDALRSLDSLLKDMVCIQYFRQFLSLHNQVELIFMLG